MAELIKSEGINTKESAVAAAQKTLESQRKLTEEKRFEFEKFMNALQNVNPELGGFDELGAMLALPEEQFAILAPIFLDELERGMRNINDQMLMVQSMNMLGMKVENVREQYEAIYQEIDNQMSDVLSHQKRDFLKQMLGMTYNALAEAEGVAKKTILIPIEYCREGAKCPTYAHLEDAGMDIYALEDVDILPGETKLIPTGIKIALPDGYAMLIHPRSGTSLKTKMRICNSIGLIDAGYRGEIGVIVENIESPMKDIQYHFDETGAIIVDSILHGSPIHIAKGERFAQMRLVEVPKAAFYQVDEVAEIGENRNSGFGGTGKF